MAGTRKETDINKKLAKMELEEIFESLNEVMDKMEDRDVSLEESFELYSDGMKMLKACNEKLDTVEKKMMTINENGELDEF